MTLMQQLAAIYAASAEEMAVKAEAYFARFEKNDAKYVQQVADGIITSDQLAEWRRRRIAEGEKYTAFVEELAALGTAADQSASTAINNAMVRYAVSGANAVNKSLATQTGLSFTAFNQSAIQELVASADLALPKRITPIEKATAWNTKLIKREITKGITQGESLAKITARIESVSSATHTQAVRAAHTAITGANAAGGQASMIKAQEDYGITLKKKWIATLDGHTLDSHSALDGQEVDTEDSFSSPLGAIRYPGDPLAKPANVWNCRCTMATVVQSIPYTTRRENTGDKNVINYTTKADYDS